MRFLLPLIFLLSCGHQDIIKNTSTIDKLIVEINKIPVKSWTVESEHINFVKKDVNIRIYNSGSLFINWRSIKLSQKLQQNLKKLFIKVSYEEIIKKLKGKVNEI